MMGGELLGGGLRREEIHFDEIISVENLLISWTEFLRGKRKRKDTQEFSLDLMDNIFQLHNELENHTYIHGKYQMFRVNDPKPRIIHKALVRDRLLHHAVYRILYPFFDKTFISDSYSCRLNKGTHKAINRFRSFGYKVSKNNTQTSWVLKCDIKKFFASIDQRILINILDSNISDKNTVWLLSEVIKSFNSGQYGIGLPLGNLTSQLFANIYMNKLDQFAKHYLKAKYYIRYADDFVILSHDKSWLEEILPKIGDFLKEELNLNLHQDKIFIKTLASGINFPGWVHFLDHRILRTSTKRRIVKRIKENPTNEETKQSYLGLISNGNSRKLRSLILKGF